MGALHAYRYASQSTLTAGDGLRLVPDDGAQVESFVFRAFIEQPTQAARSLLAVSQVARAHYFDHGAAVLSLDPVVTSNRTVLRFESLSGCNGVYARLDLLADGLDPDLDGWGTTNVDLNPPLRRALGRVISGDPLRLTLGTDSLIAETLDGAVSERRVPLPDRWLRGFANVALTSSAMAQVGELEGAKAVRALRQLTSHASTGRPFSLSFSPSGLRLSKRVAPSDATIVGPNRIEAYRRIAPHIRRLRVYAPPTRPSSERSLLPMSTAWVADLDGARFTIVLSPELYRGFSGEGLTLGPLASADDAVVAATAAILEGQEAIRTEDIAEAIAHPNGAVERAVAVLCASGRLGFDLANHAYFHRDLPFDRRTLEAGQPRLKNARQLVESGSVELKDGGAVVTSSSTTYVVRSGSTIDTCTCRWFAKHRGERGPCKHVLAAQIASEVGEDPPGRDTATGDA